MITKTTYDNLPETIDLIYRELLKLKKEFKPKEVTKQYSSFLSVDKAIEFIKDQGLTLSKSTIYKHTSNRSIPFTTFNGRIVFESKELKTWCISISQQNKRYNNK